MFNQVKKIVELLISEEQEAVLESVSLVDKPAIQKNFIYFADQIACDFYFEDEEERIVVGPAMIPNIKMPRMDEETGEVYYVYFTEESISKAAELFLKHDRASKQNTDHTRNFNEDVYVMESWIKEDRSDKSDKYGFSQLPIGTWFVKMRVNDDKIWKRVKDGELNGFSVQGSFMMGPESYEQMFSRPKKRYKKIRERYKKMYKGLEKKEKEALDQILYLVEMDSNDMFDSPEKAIMRSKELGLNGEIHSHYDSELDLLIYMPGTTMEDYTKAKEEMEIDVSALPDYTQEGATGERPISSTEFAAVEDLKVGDAVSWKTADQNPRGKITEIVREGSKKVPGADFEVNGTEEDPGYIIRMYEENAEGKWVPTDTYVGRKAGSLLKNVELSEAFVEVQPGEREDDFIPRCMKALNSEFPDEKQRAAVCYTTWRNR